MSLMRPRFNLFENRRATPAIVTDWAARVVANGGTVIGSDLDAASTIARAYMAAGISESQARVNPFLGDYAASKVPLFRGGGADVDTFNIFGSSDYSRIDGLVGNPALSKYINTGVNANTLGSGTAFHLGVYVRSQYPATSTFIAGCRDGGGNQAELNIRYVSDSKLYAGLFAYANTPLTVTKHTKLIIGNRNGGNIQGYRDGTKYYDSACSAPANTRPAVPVFIFADNNNGGGPLGGLTDGASLGGYTFGAGLDDTKAAAISLAWQRAFTKIGRASLDPGTIDCIGDSITASTGVTTASNKWQARIKIPQRWRATIQNGTPGETAQTGVTKWAAWTPTQVGNTIVVLWYGSNDIRGSWTGLQTYGWITTMIAQMLAAGATKIIVPTILYRTDLSGANETERLDANTRIKAITTSNVTVVDLAADPLLHPGTTPGNFADGIHPNDTGDGIVASYLTAAITAAGG
jgi:lysophospholipase L1-like esterase